MISQPLRHVAVHLLTPLLMCFGMALAYLGAFHQPEPNHLPVAVVGASPEVKVLAQTLKDKAGDKLEVVTLPSREDAHTRLLDRELSGAYLPDAQHPELMVATAGSDTTAMAVEKVFQQVAGQQGAPLKITDVAPTAAGDPTGQGIFFLLVALSVGSYGCVAVLGAAGGALRIRVRATVGLVAALVVSVIGIVAAAPLFHIIDHDYAAIWAMSWLYSAGIILVGLGLHTFLKHWTTLTLMVLFVMLNFTTSGGVYSPELQGGFFGALHAFWNGAGFVEGARNLLYFDGGAGFGGHVITLILWLAAGVVALITAAAYEKRRAEATTGPKHAAPHDDRAAEEEMDELVGV
ncbi:hypothetical protein DFR70_118105 [Nocardia tenerifensis]|uniref:ABC-2 family transporter n=1 Tax=Nocardia tenerifensis TaxID=228006 RepID=A0A318JPR6_9NOCA|nr:membrane protein [Nocardia tenerifensis]PXX57450.1 hypothetical protein DFR70_118105 [Nocardia tenerifensis]